MSLKVLVSRYPSQQRSRVRVSSSPPFFPNIVVPFLRNAQGRLWALARWYTARGELCSYTRQPTTKAPSSLNRNPGYPPLFICPDPGANDSLVDQLLSLRLPQHQ